jgi:hypothetical protein
LTPRLESQDGMLVITFGRRQHRLARHASDLGQESVQQAQLLLALQLPKINIEVDVIRRVRSEDH